MVSFCVQIIVLKKECAIKEHAFVYKDGEDLIATLKYNHHAIIRAKHVQEWEKTSVNFLFNGNFYKF